jgi:hypothetical protein
MRGLESGWDASLPTLPEESGPAEGSFREQFEADMTKLDARVAPIWAPDRPQRSPYTGRGARTVGLIGDRTRE